MSYMESFKGRVLIHLTNPENDDLSLSQHSFYTYAQQKVFTKESPRVIQHIERVYEVKRKLSDEEFVRKFDVSLPQKPSQGHVASLCHVIHPGSADMAKALGITTSDYAQANLDWIDAVMKVWGWKE